MLLFVAWQCAGEELSEKAKSGDFRSSLLGLQTCLLCQNMRMPIVGNRMLGNAYRMVQVVGSAMVRAARLMASNQSWSVR